MEYHFCGGCLFCLRFVACLYFVVYFEDFFAPLRYFCYLCESLNKSQGCL